MYDYIHFGGGCPPEDLINKICCTNGLCCCKGATGATGATGARETLFYAQHY